MKFTKRIVITGVCLMIILAGTLVFSVNNYNNKKWSSIDVLDSTKTMKMENITRDVDQVSHVEISKPIDLSTFSWSEHEQDAVFEELATLYKKTINDTNTDNWDANYYKSLQISRPPDISFSRGEVPVIEQLRASSYKALYIDNNIYIRIKSDNTIEESTDKGISWQSYVPTPVTTEDYVHWLDENDPLPSGIVRRAQLAQLKNGASISLGTFDKQKEMYFIQSPDLAQIQLLAQDIHFNQDRWSFVLIDGEQFLIGLNRTGTIVPMPLIKELYNEMVSCKILTETQAQQELNEKTLYLTQVGFMSPTEK